MRYADYRESLGIALSSQEKADMLCAKITMYFQDVAKILFEYYKETFSQHPDLSFKKYFQIVGEIPQNGNYGLPTVLESITRNKSISHIVSKYCVFINVAGFYIKNLEAVNLFKTQLCTFLDELGILYSISESVNSILVFPEGAKEFDRALVTEPMLWLSSYPHTQKTLAIALRQYEEGIYIRDVADNLRKALEQFLQEFLGNTKNLESNKSEICRYLGSAGVDGEIAGLFQPLINTYKNINDKYVKHNDLIDKRLLEFLLYQTGILIRMVLVVKQSETEAATHAD